MNGPLQRGGASNRALNYAILASVLFHGALLLALSLERPGKREAAMPGPIVARLVSPPAAAPAPPPAPTPAKAEPQKPEPPKPRVEAPKPVPRVAKPAPKPVPVPVPARKESSVPPPAPPAAPPQPGPPAEPAPGPPAAAVPSPSARVDPQPGGATAPPADAGLLEAYRDDLVRMARNYKRYPRVALDNNWEGRAVVRMVIGANGMIASLRVIDSAGHEVLDKQALDMLQKAKPRVQIPAALRGREFSIEIPVIYNLKDQGSG